eukprot:SAG11_NODE_7638_length_1117_cov_93.008841_2_plen_28_part_01
MPSVYDYSFYSTIRFVLGDRQIVCQIVS